MITFVGIGPGDPELLTLKAVRAMEQADVIAMPDTGLGPCVAADIAARWINSKPCLRVLMPMQGGRESWKQAHDAAARALMAMLAEGKKIAYLVLGDPSIYATSSYLMALIKPHYPCGVIPGIPTMCAAAAAVKVPLMESQESLTIIPGFTKGDALPEGNVVIMKAKHALSDILDALHGREAYLARNLGMAGEYAGPLKEAQLDEAPSYFSTVILKTQAPSTMDDATQPGGKLHASH